MESGCTLTHSLSMTPSQLTTVYAPTSSCSLTSLPSLHLSSLLDHMKKINEVHVTFSEDGVVVESFSNGVKGFSGSSKASLDAESLVKNEFKNDRELDGSVPGDVNERVCLVFSLKELRSLMQFCMASGGEGGGGGEVEAFYEVGGRPATFRMEGEGFRGELITATMDWKVNYVDKGGEKGGGEGGVEGGGGGEG
ncbi:hypothetical protein TrLO_g13679 [Triparma laevis f. longispina]|uniref:Uncharacterized protein n=1 Tax=Triparma laevis f. longispina TaxID=1714387 RepID=A0A9W6ZMT2_9STRA|nr:hypothetical protein TrLO_g13679 [Triparma laevis f. longispina]